MAKAKEKQIKVQVDIDQAREIEEMVFRWEATGLPHLGSNCGGNKANKMILIRRI